MKRNPFLYAFKEPSDAEVYAEFDEVRKHILKYRTLLFAFLWNPS